ncbi:MAG TPA: amino acid adenylation domain-containing protein [Bryobacteraceae bacterium]
MLAESDLLKAALIEIRSLRARLAASERPASEPIAIIGAGCRFPGKADSPEAFWQLLRDGVDATGPVPSGRWNAEAYYDEDFHAPGKTYVREGCFLEEIESFDAEFFGISPREAIRLDPQQRLLLEVGWEAIENAAVAPERLKANRTGVYAGFMSSDYALRQAYGAEREEADPYVLTGNDPSFLAGRLSYFLGLQGPSMTCATACSSSLVAIHLACQALRAGECELALAGGVNIVLDPLTTVMLSKLRALAKDGRCKTFDASADGYGRGEGCGMVVLERLSNAVANRDRILAVIRGSAVNHDGASAGLTVPNGVAQEKVLRAALRAAQVSPSEIGYIEAHGTGTSLGDPIELQSIARAIGREREKPLLVGSVKTNIGHLEAASGIAGLLKVALALHHRQIPAHLHLETPTPHIPWQDLPLKVPTESMHWDSVGKRVAGVSSFGLSGINAHAILEEAPAIGAAPPQDAATPRIFTLNAKTEKAFGELLARYRAYFDARPQPLWSDICFTANAGRTHFEYRAAVVAESLEEAHSLLHTVSARSSPRPPRIAFAFGNELSPEIGRELCDAYPAFQPIFEGCRQTLSLALAELWRSWGILPETADHARDADFVLRLPAPEPGRTWRCILDTLSALYTAGAAIDWAAFESGYRQPGRSIALPTYPFQRQRYWALDRDPHETPTARSSAPPAPQAASAGTLAELDAAPAAERFEIVAGAVGNQIASVLGLPSQPDRERSLLQLGLDSLMSSELKEWVRREFRADLPLGQFLSATVSSLSVSILESVDEAKPVAAPAQMDTQASAPALFPLSYGQRALWFIHQSAPESGAYNVAVALRISKRVDVQALRNALQALIDRHPALRTTMPADMDEEPLQQVHARQPVSLEVDCRSYAPGELTERLSEMSRRPFDLRSGPLFRAVLCRRSGEKHVLLLTAHHMICDALSWWALLDELQVLYRSHTSGTSPFLPSLAHTYADFVAAEQKKLSGSEGERLWSYWERQLSGELPVINLPLDFPRPALQTFQGSRHTIQIPEELTVRLRAFASRYNVTLYTALLAAFQVLLHRYTGQEDILVGSATSVRPGEFADVIGYFVNPVPVRADLSGDPEFAAFLKRMGRVTADALEHREFPFPLLVERLQPRRDPSRSPLFQVDFALSKPAPAYRQGLAAGSLEMEPYLLDEEEGQFDLGLHITEYERRLSAAFKFNTHLFLRETVERMASCFLALLEAVVSSPDQRVSQIPLLSQTERERILAAGQGPQIDYGDVCVRRLFEKQAERTPDAVALEQFGTHEELSYRELNHRANRLAHRLQTLGVGPEVICGIHLKRSPELVIAILAVLKAGGAYLPLDPSYPVERKRFMMEDASIRVLLTAGDLARDLPAPAGANLLCLDRDESTTSAGSAPNIETGSHPDRLAYVIYTSGSTGRPKGTLIVHRGLTNYLCWAIEAYRVAEGSGAPLNLAIGFDAAITSLFPPLLTGGTLVLLPEEEGIEALQSALTSGRRFSLVKLTPAHLEVLSHLGSPGSYARAANRFVIGGEALRGDMLGYWQQHAPEIELINEYGPTETVVGCCVYTAETSISGNVPIGRAIANTTLYVLDKNQQPVPFGVAGELYIGGAGVARGYLNLPEVTRARFLQDPFTGDSRSRIYRTGDLVRHLPDGNLEFLGRSDAQLKVRGYRIEPGEIEAALAGHPNVSEAAVISAAGADGKPMLAGYFVPIGAPPSVAELRGYLAERLPDYMVPALLLPIDRLPLTANGKVDRAALPSPAAHAAETDRTRPRDPIEVQLTALWEEILNVRPIGIRQNFFDLGGHSLLAVKLMTRVQQAFGEDIPLSAVLRAPTIEQLAAALRRNRHAGPRSALVPMQPSGSNLPFFCVPGAGGNTIYLYNLSRELGADQPFYGLQGLGLDGEAAPHTSVEQMASHYLAAIQSLQPHGPYWLGGHSLGGWVAFEMARLLEQKGEAVAVLAILDTPAPVMAEYRDMAAWDNAHWIAELASKIGQLLNPDLDLSAETLSGLEFTAQLLRFKEALTRADLFPDDAGVEHLSAVVELFKAHSQVKYTATGGVRAGITLYRTEKAPEHAPADSRDPTWGWSSLGNVEVHFVPGDHLTMLRPPHVAVLGKKLAACLAEASSRVQVVALQD